MKMDESSPGAPLCGPTDRLRKDRQTLSVLLVLFYMLVATARRCCELTVCMVYTSSDARGLCTQVHSQH